MAKQSLDNMRGEVQFRRQLLRQQLEGTSLFDDEFDGAGIEAVLRARMRETERIMRGLRARGITISPYLEVGAERGQRALVMENELECEGAALDLSFDMLRSCAHYAEGFGATRLPLRICGDAYHLPFRSGSLPFVFCAQTLHHFPDPEPIVREIHRVLAPGGYFYFWDEPFKQLLHVGLFEVNDSIKHRQQIGRWRRLLERFFARAVATEEEYGIIENTDVSVPMWKRSLAVFEEPQATLSVASDRVTAELLGERNPLRYAAAVLLGGGISGLCRKAGAGPAARSVEEALVSPLSLGTGEERPLRRTSDGFIAEGSDDGFPIVDGVALLLARETRQRLYPELADGADSR